jgi:hypothetical protein
MGWKRTTRRAQREIEIERERGGEREREREDKTGRERRV